MSSSAVQLCCEVKPILVAERDAHVREMIADFLGGVGYAVELVADGRAALARAQALRPRLLIAEVLLPRLDGLALCRQVKANPTTAGTQVLIVSVLAAVARAREAGADAFLLKPLGQRRFLEMVVSVLQQP